MIKRLTLLSIIIMMALGALSLLGYHALGKWAQGLEGTRLGEYAQIAEQIRKDVKTRLDAFLDEEENRPYTDYLYYHVSENAPAQQQAQVLLRSPLSGRLDHTLALVRGFDGESAPVEWYTARELIRTLRDRMTIDGEVNTIISFLAVGAGPWAVESNGLRWELNGLAWTKGSVSLSNKISSSPVNLHVRTGKFLVIQPYR